VTAILYELAERLVVFFFILYCGQQVDTFQPFRALIAESENLREIQLWINQPVAQRPQRIKSIGWDDEIGT